MSFRGRGRAARLDQDRRRLGWRLGDAARTGYLAVQAVGTREQVDLARTRDPDVGVFLRRGLYVAAARDLDRELPGRDLAQPRLARAGHRQGEVIDRALA